MLEKLTVSDLAIAEKVEASFSPSLNVVTGETGSGKSVLMGALALAVGARADSGAVRDGASEARVEAVFAPSGDLLGCIDEALAESGLAPCEEGTLVIRREIRADGKGRVWINDSPATLSALRRIGPWLVDIHGPGDNRFVLEEDFQRSAVDGYARDDAFARVKSAYEAAWARFSSVRSRLESLRSADGEAVADELDVLRFQVSEIESASLAADDETLAERHAAAAHAGETVQEANAVTEALGGDEGAAAVMAAVGARLARMSRHCPEAETWLREAEDISVRIQELSRVVADAASGIDLDGESLEELDRRLTLVNRLKRKYSTDVAGVLALAEAKKRRIGELENRGEIIAGLEREAAEAGRETAAAGAALRRARARSGTKLARDVADRLKDLGFLDSKFEVAVTDAEPSASGCDRVAFMFRPNPGEPSRELSRIASSGETARVMLALKSVIAGFDRVDVLVFDEIDANIGGETGKAVGEKMRALARHRQVIAITHLPQSAVYGDRHLVVSKSVEDGRTKMKISRAEGESRTAEIARMLGGEKLTSVVRKHAKELLQLSGRDG